MDDAALTHDEIKNAAQTAIKKQLEAWGFREPTQAAWNHYSGNAAYVVIIKYELDKSGEGLKTFLNNLPKTDIHFMTPSICQNIEQIYGQHYSNGPALDKALAEFLQPTIQQAGLADVQELENMISTTLKRTAARAILHLMGQSKGTEFDGVGIA